MSAYLMIQNPGVAPSEAFTLLGASTKRSSDSSATIGKFGTGNKQGVAVCLRNNLQPVVFCGNLKLEFGTRVQNVHDGLKNTAFNRVVVKFGGKDANGSTRTSTEDLGFVLEHGATDWGGVDLALREFVSNALDRAYEEDQHTWNVEYTSKLTPEQRIEAGKSYTPERMAFLDALKQFQSQQQCYHDVKVEIVNEAQVRAKAGHTRVFVPLTEEVLKFHNNLGKWFLHFSEPHLLNEAILPKANRNFSSKGTAVIYRRGVRVREIEQSSAKPSLFDYNLENLKLDESRKVDDWYVQYEAAKAFANASKPQLSVFWQAMADAQRVWEQEFNEYGLESLSDSQKALWSESFEATLGANAVISTDDGGEQAARKGFKVIKAPNAIVQAARKRGVRTPETVLTQDEREGRQVFDSTPDAEAAVDFAWGLVEKYGLQNGRNRPIVKTFRQVMEGGSQTLGLYRDGIVFINQDIAGNGALVTGWHGLNQQLLATALEEVCHHATGAADFTRDFQDLLLNLTVYAAKELLIP